MHGIKGESAICATNTLQFLTVPQEAKTNKPKQKKIIKRMSLPGGPSL